MCLDLQIQISDFTGVLLFLKVMHIVMSSVYQWSVMYLALVIPVLGMALQECDNSKYVVVEVCNNAIDDDSYFLEVFLAN